jgi:MSHA pilin protein MshD
VTLVELTISIAVIGIALAGTLALVRRATVASADPLIQRQASAIAEAYLEEILLRPYYDPDLGAGAGACPAPEASRPLFDNVCDYAGLDDAGAHDQTGAAVAGLTPYRVRVSVDTAATLGSLSGPGSVLRVDVRVTHALPVDFTLSGYRASY